MALKHDAQGFLAGDPIDIGRALAVWDDIRGDVRAIRQAILGVERNPAVKAFQEVAQPMARDALSKSQQKNTVAALLRPKSTPPGRDNTSPSAKAAQNPDQHAKPISKKSAEAVAKPAGRDGRGRFVKSGAQPDGGKSDDRGVTPDESALKGMADRIVSAVSGAGSGLEEADPAVKAFQEVAQPMARGFGMLSGGSGDKRKEGWFRRIYASLTGFRKDESIFNKAANKSLKGIEEKPEGSDGGSGMLGGLFGGLLSMLGRIPVIGPLLVGLTGVVGKLLSKIPVVGSLFKKAPAAGGSIGIGGASAGAAAGGAAGEAGAVAKGGLLKRAGGVAGKFAKKIPLIGSLIAIGLGASESLGIESDTTTTRDDKNAKEGKNWGGVGGGLGGMAAGAAIGTVIFPGVGTVIGGVVGAVVGDWLGANAGELIGKNFSGITQSMSDAWNEIKVDALGTWDWIKEGWDAVSAVAKDLWDGISKRFDPVLEGISKGWESVKGGFESLAAGMGAAWDAFTGFLKDKFGIDIPASVKKVVKVAGDVADSVGVGAKTAWEGAKNIAGSLVPEGLKNKIAVRRAIETGADYKQGNIAGLDDTHTRALVASTAATESAGGKLGVVNEAGYMGRYQAGAGWLADAGQIKGGGDAVKSAMKADGFTSEYKWGQSGGMTKFLKNDKNWSGDMNYDKYLASADAQDGAFKTNSDKSYQSLVKKGVITKDMSQDDIAGILKARHIGGEGGAAMAANGVAGAADANGTTALKYKTDLASGNVYAKAFSSPATIPATPVAIAAAPTVAPVAPMAPVIASASAPTIPSFASPPAIADAPPVINPLASSGEGRKAISVTMPMPDAGQDLKDRRIAHIVTGGFSA